LEGGRTGLGIVSILLLPAAVLGTILRADRRREILLPLIIAGIFFTIWFFSGTTQRTRHLLPVYPLILLATFPVAVGFVGQMRLVWPMAAGLGATLIIQFLGTTIFTSNYASYALSAESRTSFLNRNVPGANAAKWINENLSDGTKIGFMNRQLAYLINIPAFMIHPHMQVVIDARPEANDEQKFIAEIQQQGLTHLLLPGNWENVSKAGIRNVPFFNMIGGLIEDGCLRGIHFLDTIQMPSRTLAGFGGTVHRSKDGVFEIVYNKCQAIL
jgi:hypothetical protein